ncbi:hypothetical protein EI94DRAFT_464940 [Lactarius quietus]|nr:hypothetical protein EI94DRAFT_464940 [Lactarius quietus]
MWGKEVGGEKLERETLKIISCGVRSPHHYHASMRLRAGIHVARFAFVPEEKNGLIGHSPTHLEHKSIMPGSHLALHHTEFPQAGQLLCKCKFCVLLAKLTFRFCTVIMLIDSFHPLAVGVSSWGTPREGYQYLFHPSRSCTARGGIFKILLT